MKIIGGITRSVLDSILSAYATIASLASYVTTTALAAYNYATQAWTQSYVATTIAGTFAAFNYKDNVQYSVNYVQSEVPDGTGTSGELCLVTGETPSIYEYTTSWAFSSELDDSDRVVFFTSGVDTTEPGYSATMKIYTYTEGEELDEYSLVTNDIFYLDSGNTQYRYDGTTCVEYPTTANADAISSDTFDDIEATNVQDALEEINAKINDAPAECQQLNIDLPLERMKASEYVWTRNKDANSFNYSQYFATESKEGLELYYDICCTTGVYELLIVTTHYNNHGKLTVYLDDVQQGVIDTYNASVYYNINNSVFLNVLTDGQHTLKFVFSKNASSSGYFVYMSKMVLKKIAIGYIFDWAHGRYSNHKGMSMTVVAGGALTRGANGSIKPFGEWFYQAGAAENDELKSPDLTLPAGSYKVTCWTNTNNYIGIVSLYEGDNLIDTIDLYSSPAVLNYTFSKTFDLATITTTNIKTKIESKNASSFGYCFDAQCWQIEKLT